MHAILHPELPMKLSEQDLLQGAWNAASTSRDFGLLCAGQCIGGRCSLERRSRNRLEPRFHAWAMRGRASRHAPGSNTGPTFLRYIGLRRPTHRPSAIEHGRPSHGLVGLKVIRFDGSGRVGIRLDQPRPILRLVLRHYADLRGLKSFADGRCAGHRAAPQGVTEHRGWYDRTYPRWWKIPDGQERPERRRSAPHWRGVQRRADGAYGAS
jgi:hypothetical protein